MVMKWLSFRPLRGGKMIKVQSEDFNVQFEYDKLRDDNSVGAIVTFCGLVRDVNQGQSITSLTLEHYPGMTEKMLQKIVTQANKRWDLLACTVIHRIGQLTLNDQIVFVGISSLHRGDAFAACEYIMDYLKTQAPFWKMETTDSQQSYWVDAKESDLATLDKWQE